MFDPVGVDPNAAYYSGSVVSHNCSFLSTAYTLLRAEVIQNLKHTQPIAETDGGYHEFVAPDPAHTYALFVDTAGGQGLDASTFVIVDVTTLPYRVVATYANNRITTMEFPRVIMEYATRYHFPWILVEVMDIGRDIATILSRDYEYPRLMTTVAEKRLGQRLTFNTKAQRHSGLRMTSGVKRSGCAVLKSLIENGQLVVSDYRIIQELSTFIQRGATYTAEYGHHDDLVMPLVMLGWITLQPNFAEVTTTRALDSYTQVIEATKADVYPVKVDEGEVPDPVGVFHSGGMEDDDAGWLLR